MFARSMIAVVVLGTSEEKEKDEASREAVGPGSWMRNPVVGRLVLKEAGEDNPSFSVRQR